MDTNWGKHLFFKKATPSLLRGYLWRCAQESLLEELRDADGMPMIANQAPYPLYNPSGSMRKLLSVFSLYLASFIWKVQDSQRLA